MENLIELKHKIGVYQIKNIYNNKIYIGSSINLGQRIYNHFCMLSKNKHINKKLQSSWNIHTKQAFEYLILEFCNKENLIEREQFYINTYKPEYNLTPLAGSNATRITTEETKRKQSAKSKEMWKIPGMREKISNAVNDPIVKKYTHESKLKMWRNPEYRKQHSLSLQGKGNSKLTIDQVKEIRKLYKQGITCTELTKKYGFAYRAMKNILDRITYKWIEEEKNE